VSLILSPTALGSDTPGATYQEHATPYVVSARDPRDGKPFPRTLATASLALRAHTEFSKHQYTDISITDPETQSPGHNLALLQTSSVTPEGPQQPTPPG
jgi:hypothetical protein